jgi:hypothetical protein
LTLANKYVIIKLDFCSLTLQVNMDFPTFRGYGNLTSTTESQVPSWRITDQDGKFFLNVRGSLAAQTSDKEDLMNWINIQLKEGYDLNSISLGREMNRKGSSFGFAAPKTKIDPDRFFGEQREFVKRLNRKPALTCAMFYLPEESGLKLVLTTEDSAEQVDASHWLQYKGFAKRPSIQSVQVVAC